MPPSFSESDYWDKRFKDNPKPFDWLLGESCFDEEIIKFNDHLGGCAEHRVLHIGSGTSMLSFHLARSKALRPASLIRNVDFSSEAVEWGRRKQRDLSKSVSAFVPDEGTAVMEWEKVSLLDPSSLLKTSVMDSITLVIDKSTSDAIACGPDVEVHCLQQSLGRDFDSRPPATSSKKVHPLNIVALNLALTSIPGGRWLSLSYSSERYPFFESGRDALPEGVPDPARYWKLVAKNVIETEEAVQEKYKRLVGDNVHRMKTSHYLYVLERTQERLDADKILSLLRPPKAMTHPRT